MVPADLKDRKIVVDILSKSFRDNKSVNYIIHQDRHHAARLEHLMEYSFDVCYQYGKVVLSADKKACALILEPEKKKTTLLSIWLDIKLIHYCFGISNIKRAIHREQRIKALQLKGNVYYIWFIGVQPDEQHKGIGSTLLNDLIKDADSKQMTICLETSTVKNIPWYEKMGFEVYNQLDLGYALYFLKK